MNRFFGLCGTGVTVAAAVAAAVGGTGCEVGEERVQTHQLEARGDQGEADRLVALPIAVHIGFGSTVGATLIDISRTLFYGPLTDYTALSASLTEIPPLPGTPEFIGSQGPLPLSGLQVIDRVSEQGNPVIYLPWTVDNPIQSGSRVEVCTQLLDLPRNGGNPKAAGPETCLPLEPFLPLF
jgi:hypothetical protein